MSRSAPSASCDLVDIRRPFSAFEFAEKHYQGSHPIRRLFSLSRRQDGSTLIIEDVVAEDAVLSEIEAIKARHPDYKNVGLKRISFWTKLIHQKSDIKQLDSSHCIGYAILKRDIILSQNVDRWHIFEAVFIRGPHPHNYCPAINHFTFKVDEHKFSILGSLYAQQNQLNKACAQVALRSICSTYLGRPELSYEEINALAAGSDASFDPSKGLNTSQIIQVLDGLSIPYFALNYKSASPDLRQDFPFQKVLYSGLESGAGALMAFNLSGPQAPVCGHIIPCFGHTFNQDAWAPHADSAYFKIGETIQYIPSRAWMSSFVVHDDNFGANLCIPNGFLKKDQVDFVVELLPQNYKYSGALAEIVSADYFYSILPLLSSNTTANPWIRRLAYYVAAQELILRVVPISKRKYLRFLKKSKDWEGNQEDAKTIEDLKQLKPELFWMIEVSIPEVFSTNKRKLGEILLDAANPLSGKIDGTSFVLARFPERYVFFDKIDAAGTPSFMTAPSQLKSHVPLLVRS